MSNLEKPVELSPWLCDYLKRLLNLMVLAQGVPMIRRMITTTLDPYLTPLLDEIAQPYTDTFKRKI